MHIKHIHETIEKLAQYACEEACKIKETIDTKELGEVVEMVEKLAKAEYYARIAKEMEKSEEEEKEEIKYIMKKMKEEGEDWGEEEAKRFYRGQPRSKTSGRYMSRGDGRRNNGGRNRGYEDAMYYIMPEMRDNMEEYYRDLDRGMGRMYYSGGSYGGGNSSNNNSSAGGQSGNSSMSGNSSSASSRGYEDGYSDGQRRGYEEGYNEGKNSQERDRREGRSGMSRRSYMESKEMNRSNNPEGMQKKMKDLEKYMGELSSDITEMIAGSSSEEKAMIKSKLQTLAQKIV